MSKLDDHLLILFAMKKSTIIYWLAGLLVAGCTSKELKQEEAYQLLRESKLYPRMVDFDIYCSDPQQAQAVMAAGLEKEGLVTVNKTQKLGDVGEPLIQFTPKAKPYLLPSSPNDKALDVQKVKIAEEDLVEVTGITTEKDGKSAVVEYRTTYKNVNPFAALRKSSFQDKITRKSHFTLQNKEWQIGMNK